MPRIYVRHIHEEYLPGHRLGRHVHHDSRSLLYRHQAPAGREAKAQLWKRNTPILDQGNLGSCTGNALTGACGTSPIYGDLPAGHPALDENEAVALYSAATKLDSYPGTYPPDDTGSDGISVCKAGVKAGLLSGYTHCTDLAGMEQALQDGPVIVGVNWYSSFDAPASDGTVAISKDAYVRGGHEFLVRGVDPIARLFKADNSWGPNWGLSGSFQFGYATMDRLLSEQGDCTVPVPASQPAPVPTPPSPTPDDHDLLDALVALIKSGVQDLESWLTAHGL